MWWSNDYKLLLKGPSEEQIAAMSDYNYESEVELFRELLVGMTVAAQMRTPREPDWRILMKKR